MLQLLHFVLGIVVGYFLKKCIIQLTNKQHISKTTQYYYQHKPFVEILTGLTFVLCFNTLGFSLELFRILVLSCFLIVIAYIDYEHRIILDVVLFLMIGAGFIINIYIGQISPLMMLLSGLLGGSIFLLLALTSKGGFGGGDVKFMAVIGVWLGLKYTLLTMLVSIFLGGIGAAFLLFMRIKGRKDYIPFGPYMALATFLTLLYGNGMLEWYWSCIYH